ncbi:disease resistance protein RGA5 isoform X2 [Triticum aestivum]|uniref:disease resistance protein RGA5 isoform X2 n=1 Tax=Triticum aestivum TaxID=4565 RepID=UPI0008437AD4|nr:disease resistance protein RGA5-like isoform X2 [Triticum aestivum]XP_044338200.1 disease resistance protein RGA5-like isoform X2 [Triticum aestivum]
MRQKEYFVIIDGLWATSVWDVVSRAFPQNGRCSRIITTTEVMEVALACCCFIPEHIFKMEALSDKDSEKIFLQRILVPGNQSPKQFDDVIPQIVRSCGGLPLAIIIVARILASQPEKLEQWGSAHNSFESIFGVNPTMEGFMGQILNVCFISLPRYLKTCLLYLSTYPEGYLFLKEDLVKQWVAEGFICANEGEDMEEVAKRYFDELVSMGLIQVMDINCNYELFCYSVHQLVLDLITYKSIEENFITVVDYSQTTIPFNDKVRRLSLHFGSATYATTPTSSRLSQVRSLFFSGLFNCMPSFVVFKFLRVLNLHVWDDSGTTELNLTEICDLLQLRYLQVTCDVIVKLPDRIAGMKHLETLEINARSCDVPPDIVRHSSLLHLRLQGANLPSGIGGIRSLRTLMYFDLGNSSEDSLRGLGELINLQDLHLTYSSSPSSEHLKRNLIALAASVGKLCNLKNLTLATGGTAARVVLFDGSSDMFLPMFLERFELLPPICILSRLPEWIGQLRKICIVKVAVNELPTTDIAMLTGLPSLTVLWLSVQTAPEGRTVFNNKAFPVLKYFKFTCGVLCMSFMAGAMPDLRRLKLVFNTHTGEEYDNMLAGIEHLSKLQDIVVQIGATTGSDWRAAESAINEAVDKHPEFPGRIFQCVDPIAEEFRPLEKHHWSNEKSTLDEKIGVLEKSNDMNKHADIGSSQLPNLPSTVASGRLKSGSLVEESKEWAAPSSQLVGQATGLISKIIRAVEMAPQNKLECKQLARRVSAVHGVLSSLPAHPELAPPLQKLKNTLEEAHRMVIACQNRGAASHFFGSRRHADCFNQVNNRIISDIVILNLSLMTCEVLHNPNHIGVPTATIATAPSLGCSSAGIMDLAVVEHAAPVAQLVGDAAGLISKIIRAVETARQNRLECEQLARRLSTVDGVLSSLPDDRALAPPLKELNDTLQEAHGLVLSCQKRSFSSHLFARRDADRFREVSARIGSHLSLLSLLIYAAIASRLDRISPPAHTGVPSTTTVPSLGYSSGSLQTQMVEPDDCRMFTWAEIAAATNNFAVELRGGWSGRVYKGCLHEGPEVAVKVLDKHGRQDMEDAFVTERDILSPLRHEHIVRLVGWCAEDDDRMFVYEHAHMSNGTLKDHLLREREGGSSWSPVTTFWRTRIEVLLGGARAIEHLHGAVPRIIHGNVSSSNILLDASWTPRLSGFSSAVLQAEGKEQLIADTTTPASDVYSFGVVMLETLMGIPPVIGSWNKGEDPTALVYSILDDRLKATPSQLEALVLLTHMAACCLRPQGKNGPAMSDVVAILDKALAIITTQR